MPNTGELLNIEVFLNSKGSSNIGLEIENGITLMIKQWRILSTIFTTIAENLVSKLLNISGGLRGTFIDNYYQNNLVKQNAVTFLPVCQYYFQKLIENLYIRIAPGLDGLSTMFLKDDASVYLQPLRTVSSYF